MSLYPGNFHELFNIFRLRAGFRTYSEFGEALANEGVVYEDSIFSKWKNGERLPRDRQIILAILKVFVKHKGIQSIEDANKLLFSLNQRNLDENETRNFDIALDLSLEPYSRYRPLVEPRILYNSFQLTEENTRLVLLSEVTSPIRDYWFFQSLCAVSEYFAFSCPQRGKAPAEIFQVLKNDPFDRVGATTTIVAITTDPNTGQEYLSGTDRISQGTAKLEISLNCMNYVGLKNGWPYELEDLRKEQLGELDRFVIPNWAWEWRSRITRRGYEIISNYAQRKGIEYFYALVSIPMIEISNEGGLPIENIPEAYPFPFSSARESLYFSTYTDAFSLNQYWSEQFFLYRFKRFPHS